MKLYTKFDFVPGDKVLYFDDLDGEEEGEFPYRWNLDRGVFEVARLGRDPWILCTDDGYIRPKYPDGPLPAKYTVEFQFHDSGSSARSNYHYLQWVDARGLLCPQPLLAARRALAEVDPGQLIGVEATDPHAQIDFEVFCLRSGHQLVEQQHDGEVWRFVLRRRAEPGSAP